MQKHLRIEKIPLETYNPAQDDKVVEVTEKKEESQIDGLEVVDVAKEKPKIKEEEPKPAAIIESEAIPEIKKPENLPQQPDLEQGQQQAVVKIKKTRKSKGIAVSPEMEKKVDERVHEIVTGKENDEGKKTQDNIGKAE